MGHDDDLSLAMGKHLVECPSSALPVGLEAFVGFRRHRIVLETAESVGGQPQLLAFI